MSQTRSYDLRESELAVDVNVWRNSAICVCAFGLEGPTRAVRSGENGRSMKCQYLCWSLSSYPTFRADSRPEGRLPFWLPSCWYAGSSLISSAHRDARRKAIRGFSSSGTSATHVACFGLSLSNVVTFCRVSDV